MLKTCKLYKRIQSSWNQFIAPCAFPQILFPVQTKTTLNLKVSKNTQSFVYISWQTANKRPLPPPPSLVSLYSSPSPQPIPCSALCRFLRCFLSLLVCARECVLYAMPLFCLHCIWPHLYSLNKVQNFDSLVMVLPLFFSFSHCTVLYMYKPVPFVEVWMRCDFVYV